MGSPSRISNYVPTGVAQLIGMYSKPRGAIVALLPVVLGITPSAGLAAGLTLVRIYGYNFDGVSSVTIGGALATGLIVGGGIITCYTPASGTNGAKDVVVTGPAGSTTLAASFTYSGAAGGTPTVASVNYSLGDIAGGGQSIVVTGTNLSGATALTIGGTAATITGTTSTTVTATLPAHAQGSGLDIVVTTPGGSATLAAAFEYWSPIQITNVDFVGDSVKGVTNVSGKVSVWNNQKTGETVVTAQQTTAGNRPTIVANDFGTGIDAFSFTPQNFLDTYDVGAAAVRRAMSGGYSWFSVVKYTSTDTTTTQAATINCPLTIYGDTVGWGSGGFYSDKLTLAQFTTTIYSDGSTPQDGRRGSGFNDGNPHLLGYTYSSGGVAKAYKGATQQGTDVSAAYDTTNQAYNRIGAGYLAVDGFDGKFGCFVVVRGVISGGDLTKLNSWAQQRYAVT